jgi:hypothetical protein
LLDPVPEPRVARPPLAPRHPSAPDGIAEPLASSA